MSLLVIFGVTAGAWLLTQAFGAVGFGGMVVVVVVYLWILEGFYGTDAILRKVQRVQRDAEERRAAERGQLAARERERRERLRAHKGAMARRAAESKAFHDGAVRKLREWGVPVRCVPASNDPDGLS